MISSPDIAARTRALFDEVCRMAGVPITAVLEGTGTACPCAEGGRYRLEWHLQHPEAEDCRGTLRIARGRVERSLTALPVYLPALAATIPGVGRLLQPTEVPDPTGRIAEDRPLLLIPVGPQSAALTEREGDDLAEIVMEERTYRVHHLMTRRLGPEALYHVAYLTRAEEGA